MKLIAGLGNPGKKYEHTRHNVGFLMVDYLYKTLNAESRISKKWKKSKKHNAEIAECVINDEKTILVKPLTFMNDSGRSLQSLAADYEIPHHDIMVIHDDIDIAFGKFKVKSGSGDAGHNGVKSIVAHLGTRSFIRVRIGIMPTDIEKKNIDTYSFVLKRFSKQEINGLIEEIFPQVYTTLVNHDY